MFKTHSVSVGDRKLAIYLPPSYGTEDGIGYSVAYVQDGGELFDACINQLEHLFYQGQLPEIILVGIETDCRNDEYTPWPSAAVSEGRPAFGGFGKAYVDEIADVVKPYVDANYRTLPSSAHTAIIGGSLGGLISLFAGYWRPETFGRLGLLSASFWYEGVLDDSAARPALPKHVRLYLSVGEREGIYKRNAQRNMVASTLRAHEALLAANGEANRIRFVLTEGGTHDLHCMAYRFPEALAWLFGGPNEAAIEETAYALPGTRQWAMRAEPSGLEYRIFVYVPATPPPEQGYPVVYALDGNASFATFVEAMRLQGRPPHGFEPGIVVGAGYPSDAPMVTDRRFYDYTVKADPDKLPAKPDGSPWPETGGAEAFLKFIERQLMPAVERAYPVDRTRRALFGHSLGGWLALHALAERPELFSAYVAGSPSIWWNGSCLLERLPRAMAGRIEAGDAVAPVALYIGIGADEKPKMVEEAERMARLLEPFRDRGGLRLEYRSFEGDGHVSVIPALISASLRFILRQGGASDGTRGTH